MLLDVSTAHYEENSDPCQEHCSQSGYGVSMPTLSSARQMARDAVMTDIVTEARRQLVEVGPAGGRQVAHLRVVAGEVGEVVPRDLVGAVGG